MERDAIQAVACDILVPAAGQDSLTARYAEQLQASIVLELANGPVTLQADEVLAAKGVFVIPDFVANAGGVVASYYEWQANLRYDRQTGTEAYRGRLQEQMTQTYERARATQLDYSKRCSSHQPARGRPHLRHRRAAQSHPGAGHISVNSINLELRKSGKTFLSLGVPD